ncbi:MAG: hypothetical protein GX444_00775 [Myxococcales bacterium]|nr:hypothetical protein [Myxococcales bacterium]
MSRAKTIAVLLVLLGVGFGLAIPAAAAPEDPWCQGVAGICVTNVTSAAFSVSWTTLDAPVDGIVYYGDNPGSITTPVCDDRGCGSDSAHQYETHHATIKGLAANSTYYFRIESGGVPYPSGGAYWMQTTGKSLTPGAPVGRMISILLDDNPREGAPDSLVYLKLINNDGSGSTGESAVFSVVITDPDGLESFSIDRIRTANSQAFFSFSDNDLIKIYADDESSGYGSYQGAAGNDFPDILLEACSGCYIYDGVTKTFGCFAYGGTDASHGCQYCYNNAPHVWSIRGSGYECRAAAGVCDVAELCTGTAIDCPTDAYQPSTTVCRVGSGDLCDPSENCPGTGVSCPADTILPSTTVCNAGSGDLCDPDEKCTGIAGQTCPTDAYQPSTTVCNAGSGDLCDPDEKCPGVPDQACPTDTITAVNTVCRAGSGDLCDPDEKCTGIADQACPTNTVLPSTTVCNAGSGDLCDPDEKCPGVAGQACPTDTYLTADAVCRPGSGDLCDPDEKCPGVADQACPANSVLPSTTVCRTGSGDLCDPDEKCSGVAGQACPSDTVRSAATVCRTGSGDLCDPDEKCPGVAKEQCPTDTVLPSTTVCNAGSGDLCDPDEKCTGTAGQSCPTDRIEPSTTVCNAGSGDLCDPDEKCTGVADQACPTDRIEPSTTVCRATAGICDVQELCSGAADQACPADAKLGGETTCRASVAYCDLAEVCDGSNNACPTDVFRAAGTTCDDANACTSGDQCNGGSVCAGTADPGAYLQVLTPAPAGVLAGGIATPITWNYNHGATCDIGTYHYDNVRLSASIDGGVTYPVIIANSATDNGTYNWAIPPINESLLRIKVEPLKAGVVKGTDATDDNFAVYMPTNLVATKDYAGDVVLTWSDGQQADVYYAYSPYGNSGWSYRGTATSPYTDLGSATEDHIYFRLKNKDGSWYSPEVVGKETVMLTQGFNLINLTFEHEGTKAQDLLDELNAGGVLRAKSVIRWDPGAQWWDIHYNSYPTYNNFTLQMGMGYFVEVLQAVNWTLVGSIVKEPIHFALGYDYNLLGLPTGEWSKAQNVLDAVDAQGGVGYAIYRWVSYAQWWDAHFRQYPSANNFDIDNAEGYFIRNDTAIPSFKLNPMQIAAIPESSPRGFTVSWKTVMNATGWLRYGTAPGALNNYLEVDAFDLATVHGVTVPVATGGTYYYTLVVSGIEYDDRGVPFQVIVP